MAAFNAHTTTSSEPFDYPKSSLQPSRRYKKAPDRKHIGPYAEDMKSVFGIGNGDGLSSMDVAGISLRLGQALLRKVEELEKRVEELESKE